MPQQQSSTVPELSSSKIWQINPVKFATQHLGVTPWRKQAEILNALARHNHVAVRSCNGSGKTFTAAVATLWWLMIHDDAIVVTTAPTKRQVTNLLWREIRNLHQRNIEVIGGRIFKTRLEFSPKRYAIGFSTNTGDKFQGFHSPNILVIVDEAAAVLETVYDAISGCLTTKHSKLLMIGNPTTLAGTFYDAFHKNRDLYKTIRISAFDTPAFTGEIPPDQTVPTGLITPEWVQRIKRQRGEQSAEYFYRVLGDYPIKAVDTLISLYDIERATKQEFPDEPNEKPVMGLDIARYGDNHSVAVVRKGKTVTWLEAFPKCDLMETAGRATRIIRQFGVKHAFIDEVGMGSGVLDRIREIDEVQAYGVNGGNKPNDPKLHFNKRAQMFDHLKEVFENGNISIPDDPELISQVASLNYRYTSAGALRLEGKEVMRNNGRPSPDKADALALAFTDPPSRPPFLMYIPP